MYSSKLRVFVSRLQLQRTLNVFESKGPLSNMVLPINSTPSTKNTFVPFNPQFNSVEIDELYSHLESSNEQYDSEPRSFRLKSPW